MRTRELRRGTRYPGAGGWLRRQAALSAPEEIDEPNGPYPSRSVIVPSAIVTAREPFDDRIGRSMQYKGGHASG